MSLIIEKDYSSIHRKSNHHPGPVSHKAIKEEASSLKADETSGSGAWCSPRGSWTRGKKSPSTCKIRAPSLPAFPTTIMTLFRFFLIAHTKKHNTNTHTHTHTHKRTISLRVQSSLCVPLCTHNRPTVTLSGRQPSKYQHWCWLFQSTETPHSLNSAVL